MDDPAFKNPLLRDLSDETKGYLIEAHHLMDDEDDPSDVLLQVTQLLKGVPKQHMGNILTFCLHHDMSLVADLIGKQAEVFSAFLRQYPVIVNVPVDYEELGLTNISPFHQACNNGNETLVRCLLDAGADISAQCSQIYSDEYYLGEDFILPDYLQTVRSRCPEIPYEALYTPAFYAVRIDLVHILEILCDYDLEKKGDIKYVLFLAIVHKSVKCVTLVLERYQELLNKESLLYALKIATWRSWEMVKILKNFGCHYSDDFLEKNPQILAETLRYQNTEHLDLESSCCPILQELLRMCTASGLNHIDLDATLNALLARVTLKKYCDGHLEEFYSDLTDFLKLLVSTFPTITMDRSFGKELLQIICAYIESSCEEQEQRDYQGPTQSLLHLGEVTYSLQVMRTIQELGFTLPSHDQESCENGSIDVAGARGHDELNHTTCGLQIAFSDEVANLTGDVSTTDDVIECSRTEQEDGVLFHRLLNTMSRVLSLKVQPDDDLRDAFLYVFDSVAPSRVDPGRIPLVELRQHPDTLTINHTINYSRLVMQVLQRLWARDWPVSDPMTSEMTLLQRLVKFFCARSLFDHRLNISHLILVVAGRADMEREGCGLNSCLKYLFNYFSHKYPDIAYHLQRTRHRTYMNVIGYVVRSLSITHRNQLTSLNKIRELPGEYEGKLKNSLEEFHKGLTNLLIQVSTLKYMCCKVIRGRLLNTLNTQNTRSFTRHGESNDKGRTFSPTDPELMRGGMKTLTDLELVPEMPLIPLAGELDIPRTLLDDVTGYTELMSAIWAEWKEPLSQIK